MPDNGPYGVGDRVMLEGTVLSERSGFVRVRWANGSVTHEWAPDLKVPDPEVATLLADYAELADGIEAREAELERLRAVASSPQPATAPGQATDHK